MILPLLLTAAALASAKPQLDLSRCNVLAGHAGIGIGIGNADDAEPFYRLDDDGNLSFDKNNESTLLVSAKKTELTYYEHATNSVRIGGGLGELGIIKSQVTLTKNRKGEPERLESKDSFYSTSGDWKSARKKLKAGSLTLKKNERARETDSWITFGFSKNRCYVDQEGRTVKNQKLVTYDQTLCNQVLQISDRGAGEVLADFRGKDPAAKNEANRVLRLIRDAQVARDERLKSENMRLLAAESTSQHSLPGTLSNEDASALQELRGCVTGQVRNGLRRPEALSKERMDFMGNEPSSGGAEPSASGNVDAPQ
jgi:hypothetical protein